MSNSNHFLLQWLANLNVEHAQNMEYHNNLMRLYDAREAVYAEVFVDRWNGVQIERNNFDANNQVAENADNISIITISDDGDQPAILTGSDVLLSAGLIENVEGRNINETVSDNDETESENDSGYGGSDMAIERLNRVRNAAAVAASNIRAQILNEDISDAETEIFDFERERNRHLLVMYSDSDSDDESDSDSVFGKFSDEPTETTSDGPPKCPVCYGELLKKRPHCIHPCGHFICLECLIRLCKLPKREWKCPMCREQIESKHQCTRAFFYI